VHVESGTWRIDLHEEADTCAVEAVFRDPATGERGRALVPVPPPPEIEMRGLSLRGLQAWARALGGEVAARPPESFSVPDATRAAEVPTDEGLPPWLLALAFSDLVLKRVFPGRRKEVGSAA
jgi:hypothetical protein